MEGAFCGVLKILGSIIVSYFGLSIILGGFGIKILPEINLITGNKVSNSFIKVLLMTVSNPLTILFFLGVFSTKIAEKNIDKRNIGNFAIGTVTATFIFMTLVVLIGTVAYKFVPVFIINILIRLA